MVSALNMRRVPGAGPIPGRCSATADQRPGMGA